MEGTPTPYSLADAGASNRGEVNGEDLAVLRSLEIRSEMPGEEEAIDAVHSRAFGQMDEAHLVRLIRMHYPAYDRRYSLTGWLGDEMVGHALFSPARLRLMDKTLSALAVAPVAVVPEWQRRGIGGALLHAGHDLGASEGFELTFLDGDPDYYPRHGYLPCFGHGRVVIDATRLPEPREPLRPMPVRPADIPWLFERYMEEWADVDFCWQRGTSLAEWSLPGTNALIWWTEYGRRAAYTLGWPGRRGYQMILGEDPMLIRCVLAVITPKLLRQHPAGWFARNVVEPEWGRAEVTRSRSEMARELRHGVLNPYLRALEAQQRLPGFCLWPLPFMAC